MRVAILVLKIPKKIYAASRRYFPLSGPKGPFCFAKRPFRTIKRKFRREAAYLILGLLTYN